MNDDLKAFARRAVACKGFRWMAGMLVVLGSVSGRVLDAAESFIVVHFDGPTRDGGGLFDGPVPPDLFPDLTDPATLGCLEARLIDAWHHKVVIMNGNGWWSVESDDDGVWDQRNTVTFAHALVAALEAAPCEP